MAGSSCDRSWRNETFRQNVGTRIFQSVTSTTGLGPNIASSAVSSMIRRSPGTVGVASPGSSHNITGSTPGSADWTPPDEQAYMEKLNQLAKYKEPLRRMLARIHKDESRKKELIKLTNLLAILSDPNKRCPMETLLKCEHVLKRAELKEQALSTQDTVGSHSAVSPSSNPHPTSVSRLDGAGYSQTGLPGGTAPLIFGTAGPQRAQNVMVSTPRGLEHLVPQQSVKLKIITGRWDNSGKPVGERSFNIDLPFGSINKDNVLSKVRELLPQADLYTSSGAPIPDKVFNKGSWLRATQLGNVFALEPNVPVRKRLHENQTDEDGSNCFKKNCGVEHKAPQDLSSLIKDTFECRICLRSPMSPPAAFQSCCQIILGCMTCAQSFYGENKEKCCPHCQKKSGRSNLLQVKGLDDFLHKTGHLEDIN
ncbi:uncharacterized protein LOC106468688 [Limulus polyphemus]|uniref:Uncharacterized protein LOC106468688 n=1 Tax=Limulus polyphemus TaxID=6850 RepID=A0ABM1BLT0_LIMPO|nr:uncharacterized protein LOC106468688 [Limulus polyphemus]